MLFPHSWWLRSNLWETDFFSPLWPLPATVFWDYFYPHWVLKLCWPSFHWMVLLVTGPNLETSVVLYFNVYTALGLSLQVLNLRTSHFFPSLLINKPLDLLKSTRLAQWVRKHVFENPHISEREAFILFDSNLIFCSVCFYHITLHFAPPLNVMGIFCPAF